MILDKLLPTDFFSGFIDGAFGLVAILVIGAACVYFWFRGNEKKKWNIDISIHKTIGDGEVWIPTIGKQDADEKGIVRFEGKLFNIDLPAVDSQFFSLSGKGVNRRHIDIWNPQPNVFLPMARDYLRINNRKYKRVSETQCMYCDYVNKCKEDNKDAKFSSDDFKIHIKELKEIPICTTHLNLYFKAKFKVVGEAPKEFLWVRAKERLLRSITKVAWYNQPGLVLPC